MAAGPAGGLDVPPVAAPTVATIEKSDEGCAAKASCCPRFHEAVELVGKRWTGAILSVLMDGPLRFSEVKVLVPDLSDRLLSERLKELEAEGLVDRIVVDGNPPRVQYLLTQKGMALEPALESLKGWARSWLD